MKTKQVEAYFELKHEIPDAILVTDGFNDVWLPKSQIKMQHVKDNDFKIKMPHWLAYQKGII